MKRERYAKRTVRTYLDWATRFHRWRSAKGKDFDLAGMTGIDLREFLDHLAIEREVTASTQNQALSDLLYLIRKIGGVPAEALELTEGLRAKRGRKLPEVLSRGEVRRLLDAIGMGTPGLMARLLYGAGLRKTECLRIRVKDIQLERGSS